MLVTGFHSVPVEEGGGHRLNMNSLKMQSFFFLRCKGHGTHVAGGVVIGSDSGVAPGARVSLVHVLDGQRKGSL